ncbi:MAG: hypothetical protein KJO31_05740 [Gammaproteobacteria bacterium]|nr:hypothetical protein [Gammaproteobacteria bacterium]
MRPPICDLCGRDAHGGELVSFRDYEALPDGMTGHPRGLCWFCTRHVDAANALQDLDTADAFRRLRRKFFWGLLAGTASMFVRKILTNR